MPSKFRPVNTILGSQPRLGPIPADQIIPWFCITGAAYLMGRGFNLSWVSIGFITAWGVSTWWILTGGKSWKFTAKFVPTPTWSRGYARYLRFTSDETENWQTPAKTRQSIRRFTHTI
ncbi:hypothetical protein [Leptothoe sp. PORK10 BA2]|uniref:hypothetical protein n=1 Tax=Leptothoe sp. PORK10 BA2 TaxID=3110254 RepID=UPI002B20D697|nr:hypothetical protein [Leptothoe sp. PORK10 BA2]MEA5464230.1 hypothetical protein [Leptothoe sp. PORK10 BA2]